ncbi:CLUMA_CG005838, isoform A [Clunio marinus]|uniref:CLUMA_CG005838, isoform A n=1 Tax=Clunio marinus TaxID=568069 RepID=A0A1J1I1H7_9DIPT|nr:CLUMA_CG005838, isoform A [Clunio marinus]
MSASVLKFDARVAARHMHGRYKQIIIIYGFQSDDRHKQMKIPFPVLHSNVDDGDNNRKKVIAVC